MMKLLQTGWCGECRLDQLDRCRRNQLPPSARRNPGSTKNLGVNEYAFRILANTSAFASPNRIVEETHVEAPEASELPSPGDPEDSRTLNSVARLDPQDLGGSQAGADPNARDQRFSMTALLLAVQHGRIDVVDALGKAGADPNLERNGMDRFTPLHLAAQRNNIAAVEALLALGADAARRTWLTPVDWAESRPVIEALGKAGADPNARCPNSGQTPLHRRSCRCHLEPIAALLDAGADVAARDLQGRTPLHHVTLGHRRGDVARAVMLLLDAGADPEARDGNGETVITLAARRRDPVSVRALVDAGVAAAS